MNRMTRRNFLQRSLLTASLATPLGLRAWAGPRAKPVGANDDIRVAVIGLGQLGPPGVGARGHQLIDHLRQVPGVRIAALCDVDTQILAREVQRFAAWNEPVQSYGDLREVFDSQDLDAVFIATPNHWHALATIWACQAGKDVYVEKPASHSLWEGRQMVAAARKYERMVQVGTQARSSDITQQAAEFIHSGKLGKILYAKAIVYRRRTSIGKVDGPQPVPQSVDHNLWLGPAAETPLMRTVFHYDWHWDWSTGNGEIGNNGVHYLDRCRWLLGQPGLPRRAISVGGRFAFDDDGQTPNTQVAWLDYEQAPILCEVRGLPERVGSTTMDKHRSLAVGMIVQCEGGHYAEGSGISAVFDRDGKQITAFTDRTSAAEQASPHQVNFFDAVRSRNRADLHAEILDGHHSTALCHLANVSYRLGGQPDAPESLAAAASHPQWSDACERFGDHLRANGIDLEETLATLGPWVTLDPAAEVFVGESAEQANSLSRRQYREPFTVPEIA